MNAPQNQRPEPKASIKVTPAMTKRPPAAFWMTFRADNSSRPNLGKNKVNRMPNRKTKKVVVAEMAETSATGASSEA